MLWMVRLPSAMHTAVTDHAKFMTLAGSILSVESNQNVESKTKNVESKIAFLLQEISYFEP